jgi:rRNA maturation endonuclease Nob1
MNRLRCEDCVTVFYSAAAKTLVEQGVTCAKCGGRLVVDENGASHVAVAGSSPGNGEDSE